MLLQSQIVNGIEWRCEDESFLSAWHPPLMWVKVHVVSLHVKDTLFSCSVIGISTR